MLSISLVSNIASERIHHLVDGRDHWEGEVLKNDPLQPDVPWSDLSLGSCTQKFSVQQTALASSNIRLKRKATKGETKERIFTNFGGNCNEKIKSAKTKFKMSIK